MIGETRKELDAFIDQVNEGSGKKVTYRWWPTENLTLQLGGKPFRTFYEMSNPDDSYRAALSFLRRQAVFQYDKLADKHDS